MFNWNHKDEGTFKKIPDGRYAALIKRIGTITEKGELKLKVTLKVKLPNVSDALLVVKFNNQENWLYLLRHFFESAGKPHLYQKDCLDAADEKELLGQQVIVIVKNELYNGKEYSNAKDFITKEHDTVLGAFNSSGAQSNDDAQSFENVFDDDIKF